MLDRHRACRQHHHVQKHMQAHMRYAASSSTTRISHCTFRNTEDPARFCSASIKPSFTLPTCICDLHTRFFLRARRDIIAENQCEKTRERSGQEENAILHHELLVALKRAQWFNKQDFRFTYRIYGTTFSFRI